MLTLARVISGDKPCLFSCTCFPHRIFHTERRRGGKACGFTWPHSGFSHWLEECIPLGAPAGHLVVYGTLTRSPPAMTVGRVEASAAILSWAYLSVSGEWGVKEDFLSSSCPGNLSLSLSSCS
ncbi:hypothetical protein VULLAG_LOCUS20825 [Vulpes lagopus]